MKHRAASERNRRGVFPLSFPPLLRERIIDLSPIVDKEVDVQTFEGVVKGRLLGIDHLTKHVYAFVLNDKKIINSAHVISVRVRNGQT